MKRITVFCGSNLGNDRVYEEQAYLLGKTLASLGIGVVYGGAKLGLMGVVANAAMENGGEVVGVMPEFLQKKEIAHTNLTKLILVETMHERKIRMHELSDGIIALPGGFGTIEEFFEMLTWAQLGLHKKPVALLNVNGFYDPLITLIQSMVEKGFLKDVYQKMLIASDNIGDVLEGMENHEGPTVDKWITKKTT